MKASILFLIAFSLMPCKMTYAKSDTYYEEEGTKKTRAIVVYKVYHIGNATEDLHVLKFPTKVNVGKAQFGFLYIDGRNIVLSQN